MRHAIFVLAVVVLVATAAASITTAQQPPALPCQFYGNVTIDGAPAPVGTEIVAKIDGEVRGNITVVEEGKYGGSHAQKLIVVGNMSDEGKNITFYVDGIKAEQTAAWHSGGIFTLDISAKTQMPTPTPPGFEIMSSLLALTAALLAAKGRRKA
ncbi:MAG: PKD repeat domain protein [Candidatus Alkanophagales archaeon MCA70_species_2]|nr:PKD repeat domain protein [Candidatus Alkanophaga liquidiphilum]